MTHYVIFKSSKGYKDLIFVTDFLTEAKENSKRWHNANQQVNYKVYQSFYDGTICTENSPIIINGEVNINKKH